MLWAVATMRGPARNGDSDTSAVHGMSGSHERIAGVPTKKMAYDAAYDGSGNDAEASSDALWHEDVPLRTRRSRRELAQTAREARKTPMERRRSSGRRSGAVPNLSLSRADADEYAVDDEPQDARIRRGRAVVPQTSSLMRAIAEAFLFVSLACGVAYKMYAQGNEEVRAKLPELVFLMLLSLTCFVTHLNTTCTVWATRVRYLRKTDMSDPLYALLVMPLLSSVYLLDAVPRDGRGPFSPLRMSLEPDAEWRAALLPSIGPTYYDDHAQVIRDRSAMLDTHIIFGTVIGIHILATTWHRRQSKRQGKHMQIENMPAFTAFAYYVAFALGVTALIGAIKTALYFSGQSRLLFGTLSIWETMVDALLFQCSVYAWTRIARQNCTLGELSMACIFNTTLLLEAIYLTFSKLGTPSVVKTFRTPSVLLAYQLALVVGMLLIGLLLSPLLALSRVLAQRPTHRLRWPDKRNLHRRLLALAFFLFSALLIFGTLGPWVWWMLGRRNPWLYVARFMLQGRYWWSRIALLVYWGILCNIALLSLQLMVNRVWQYATVGDQVQAQAMKRRAAARAEATSGARTMPTTSERAGTLAASRFAALHAEGERTSLGPALAVTVNGRRKFFHMLAVFLFIPGIAWDVRTSTNAACLYVPRL